ncbi:MAG: hypothetical protein AB8B55_15945 [Mariniblastus sp.]
MKTLFIIAAVLLSVSTGFAQSERRSGHQVNSEADRKPGAVGLKDKTSTKIETMTPRGLTGKVRVIFDSQTGQIRLVGASGDIEIVEDFINALSNNMPRKGKVVAKIGLKFQMAETVALLLGETMSNEMQSNPKLTIQSLHFPEAILLTGPKSSIEKGKRLIEVIDSHPKFAR